MYMEDQLENNIKNLIIITYLHFKKHLLFLFKQKIIINNLIQILPAQGTNMWYLQIKTYLTKSRIFFASHFWTVLNHRI